MKAISLQPPEAQRHRPGEHTLLWKIQLRPSPGQGQRRAREKGNLHFPCGIEHVLGVVPRVGQMFIVEDRDNAFVLAEYLDYCVEETPAWVHALTSVLGIGVITLLT